MGEHADLLRQRANDPAHIRSHAMAALCESTADRIEQLEAIVERLPKPADGVPHDVVSDASARRSNQGRHDETRSQRIF